MRRWWLFLLLFATTARADYYVIQECDSTHDGYYKMDGSTWGVTSTHVFGNNSGSWGSWFMWPLKVEAGATIKGAWVRFHSSADRTGTTCNASIAFQDTANAKLPTSWADFDAKSWLTATSWNSIASWGDVDANSCDTMELSDTVTGQIQALVDKAGFTPGNNVLGRIQDNSSDASAYRSFYSASGSQTYTGPTLIVLVESDTCDMWDTVINQTDTNSAQNNGTTFTMNGTSTRMGNRISVIYNSPQRAKSNIPADAEITFAEWRFKAAATRTGTCVLRVFIEDTADADNLLDYSDFAARVMSVDSQRWSAPAVTAGQWYYDTVTSLAQVSVDRAGYDSASHVLYVWYGDVADENVYRDPTRYYTGAVQSQQWRSPVYHVRYLPPSGGTVIWPPKYLRSKSGVGILRSTGGATHRR